MSHPIACFTEDEDDIFVMAYRLFARENNWDNILLKSDNSRDYQIITGVKRDQEITIKEIQYIKPREGTSG